MLKSYILTLSVFLSILIYSCSASTDTRYSKDSDKKTEKSEEKTNIVEDDFDLSPYRTQFEISPDKKNSKDMAKDLWYEYPEELSESDLNTKLEIEPQRTIVDSIPGYRVQVISTDDLEEAKAVRSEIFFKTNEKAIYVIFEPPFYSVRVGDYKNINDAKSVGFKLNQLGFQGTKVVSDIINIFK